MSQLKITLPDGSVREFSKPTTAYAIASAIGKRLGEAAIGAKVDGHEYDVLRPIESDAKVAILTKDSKEGLEILRHSTAHLMAQAVKELYPGSQLTIGPVIEDGFFYDIDSPTQITVDDLPKIEKRMGEIVARKLEVSRKEFPRPEAIALFDKLGEKYKIELINSFPPDEPVSAYQQGDFIDLCRGPHVPNTERIGKFKLLSVAGAYWRGDEKNKMLQRIYGTAFWSQKELDEYLKRIEEARKRDHRKLGPELGLFAFLPIAPAMPFYLPKGASLFNRLADYMREETRKQGYEEVICPQLMNSELWIRSGHWDHYKENMFVVEKEDEQTLALKPMNCPGHFSLYASTKHSYRELPLRYSEFSRLHRNERAGVTHGIMRTRSFAQDDGHIFLAENQIQDETIKFIKHLYEIYTAFGFDTIDVKLATRPEKYMGTIEDWEVAEKALADALNASNVKFEIAAGEGAFYGPKLEFHIRDSIGRYWQCGTIQVDRSNPERFGLEYIAADGQAHRPVVLHRAVLGSLERFMGILIEHHNGHFPVWISPTQVVVINVTPDQQAYAAGLCDWMESWGVRVERDFRNEKLGYKIREAQMQKAPLMIVLGNKEVEAGTISVRKHTGENLNDLTKEKFREFLEPQLKPSGGNTH